MAVEICSDSDLPESLNTERKQAAKAKQVVSARYGVEVKRSRGPSVQGFYSRTRIVTLAGGLEEVVVQFRVVQLDVKYMEKAREKLGEVVPWVEHIPDPELERNGVWIYLMSLVPGKLWSDVVDDAGPGNVLTTMSVARILARGQVDGDTATIVDRDLRPKLELLLQGAKSSTTTTLEPLRKHVEALLRDVETLKKLPLFISHFDLNKTNVLVGKDGEVTGIVDWELASDAPFGLGLHRIHDMAGYISRGRFIMPANFEETERAFWRVVLDHVSAATREIVEDNLEAVRTALNIGSLIFYLFPDGTDEIHEPTSQEIEYLCKILGYRLPLQRGNDAPYAL